MRIGIDVGGTNTDAVLMQEARVVAAVKAPTSSDVLSGIRTAIGRLLASAQVDPGRIGVVTIGTTHFTNAVVSAIGLAPTAAVRLSLPAGSAVTPMSDWPAGLTSALGPHIYEANGGYEFDGRPIASLDYNQLSRIAADLRERRIRSLALTSVFAPLKADAELAAQAFFQRELPGIRISMSHEIGRVGLLERENATIINAALLELAEVATDAFRGALQDSGIRAPLYLSQNDGTLMEVERARRFPVTTFSSGPTNSMRGAALLSGLENCVVIDIGGTTTDIGVLTGGFPRQATTHVEIGGVRTNFRMPDLLSLGIGGGSLVDLDSLSVGPRSVGFRLTHESLVFGGSTLTASDVAVAAGAAEFGLLQRVAHIDRQRARAVLDRIAERIAEAVDRVQASKEALPVVLVGGGAILVDRDLPGLGPVIRPPHADVANAVGAAIAQVGAEVDRVLTLDGKNRNAELDAVKADAMQRVIAAGAEASTVELVEIDEVPIAYLPGDCVRVRAKAVGDLKFPRPEAV
jgi:N-methylhydantoinase A/oxoprolinase/acetone carboxylase beta subunit